jgi:hypothetical protein
LGYVPELLTGHNNFAYGAGRVLKLEPLTKSTERTNLANILMFRIGIVDHRYLANSETIAFVSDQSLAVLRQAQ